MINRNRFLCLIGAAIVLFSMTLCGCLCSECTTHMCSKGNSAKYGQDQSYMKFDYKHHELANGLDVITLEDFSTPIVNVQVWYHVGSKNENPLRQGFAHMFEHMMFKGTDRVGEKEHFGLIHRVGGSNNAYTSFDTTVYYETVPSNQLDLALWLEAERMTFLTINQESFDTERKVVEEELRMRQNKPFGTLLKKVSPEIFKVHPYRWMPIGELSHLRQSEVKELREFWKKYYVPNNATLVIVGAVKHDDALEKAKEYFGWIPKEPDPERVTIRETLPISGKTVTIDDENAPAGLVGLVWRTVPRGHEDEVVLDCLHMILGEGNSSRLYRKLVAENMLAVKTMTTTYNLEHDGIFVAGAAENPNISESDKIIKKMKGVIEKIKRKGVSEEELLKARNQMLKSLVIESLDISSKARMLGNAAVVIGDTSYVNTVADRIKNVTTEDIKRAAVKYLDFDKCLTVIVRKNQKGQMAGSKDDESALVTAVKETEEVLPGREGVERPGYFPYKAPIKELSNEMVSPDYEKTKMANGMTVLTVTNDEVPFITVTLGFDGGAWTDRTAGTASMAMKMLTTGTEHYSEGELAEELDKYAIDLKGSAGMDTSEVNVNFLPEYTDKAIGLLAEVVVRSVFDKKEFNKLRQQVLTRAAIRQQEPDYLAEKQFRKRLYGEHPYARTVEGEVEDIEKLSVKDVELWRQKWLRPDTATLIFAGDITHEEALETAKKYFGQWETNLVPVGQVLADIPSQEQTQIYLVDRPGSMQSEIRVGQLGITRKKQPEYFISRVVNNYFGWSFNSRLSETIRIEKGLTYSVYGGYTARNMAGEFKVSTFTKNATTGETVSVLLDVIGQLKTTEPTDTELNESKDHIAGAFVRHRETPQQVAGDLWLIESQGLQKDYIEDLLDGVAQTDKEDCVNLVEETLDPDNFIIVVVGDASVIKEDLEKTAPVTVIESSKDSKVPAVAAAK